ncbi:hypothetical protein KC340_g1620 [Hortaea werneckii]|nr:hypothetical protein KC339_g3166 [Hortaea werneckii]KAI7336621.1 hypothetical protein KC340_g1620 [Hortaea werneckii]
MSTATDDRFLFAIIKQLDGSIDWQKVADECKIVTKGAAAKRFSRLKAKLEAGGNNDTEESRNGETASPEASAKKAKQRNTPKKPASKKRKVEETEETPEAQDTVKEENELKVQATSVDVLRWSQSGDGEGGQAEITFDNYGETHQRFIFDVLRQMQDVKIDYGALARSLTAENATPTTLSTQNRTTKLKGVIKSSPATADATPSVTSNLRKREKSPDDGDACGTKAKVRKTGNP